MNDGAGVKKPTGMPLPRATDYIPKVTIDWLYLQSEEISVGMSA